MRHRPRRDFFAARLLKMPEGGCFPLVIAGAIFTLMVTWSHGREIMMREAHARAGATPLEPFLESLFADPPVRLAGTAIFLTIDLDGVPHSLLKNLEHNCVLHEQVVFLNVIYQQRRSGARSCSRQCRATWAISRTTSICRRTG